MFTNYNIIIANNVNQYTFTYELKTHRPAQTWASTISKLTTDNIRPLMGHLRGADDNYEPLVEDFLHLVEDLNTWMSHKIDKVWDPTDIQKNVNEFHTHFPEYNHEKDTKRRDQLERYNDLLHEIETMSTVRIFKKMSLFFIVCVDHKTNFPIYTPYEFEDYQYFDVKRRFGDLTIAYHHIGRHPAEIYRAKDIDTPTDQIVCEDRLGPNHYMFFYNNRLNKDEFDKFYYTSGVEWPYALDDPRLAVGSIKIGELKTVNGNVLTVDEICSIVKSCTKVLGWSVE